MSGPHDRPTGRPEAPAGGEARPGLRARPRAGAPRLPQAERRARVGPVLVSLPEAAPDSLRAILLDLARRRGPGKTFCPSEAARALGGDWRARMGAVRAEAAILCEEGRLVASQGGVAVNPFAARGPIRLGLPGPGRG